MRREHLHPRRCGEAGSSPGPAGGRSSCTAKVDSSDAFDQSDQTFLGMLRSGLARTSLPRADPLLSLLFLSQATQTTPGTSDLRGLPYQGLHVTTHVEEELY